VNLELSPRWRIDNDDVVSSRPARPRSTTTAVPAVRTAAHRIRAVAEGCETGVIKDQDIEGLTLEFGKISAHLSGPQNPKLEMVIVPGGDEDIRGHPDGLGRPEEHERSGRDLQNGDRDEEVDAFQWTALRLMFPSARTASPTCGTWSEWRRLTQTSRRRRGLRRPHDLEAGKHLSRCAIEHGAQFKELCSGARAMMTEMLSVRPFVGESDQNVARGLGSLVSTTTR